MSIDKNKTSEVEPSVIEDSKPEITTIEDAFKTVKGYLFNALSGVVKINRNQAAEVRSDLLLLNEQLTDLGQPAMDEKTYIDRKFSQLFKKVSKKSNGFKSYEFKGSNNGGLKNAPDPMKELYKSFMALVEKMPESVQLDGNWYIPDSKDDYKRPQFTNTMRKNDNNGNSKDDEQKRINKEVQRVLNATVSELTEVKEPTEEQPEEQPEVNPINQ